MERFKDECIHVKACPEVLKISGFMNGINNPELIRKLNDKVPQTFDELMKRTRSFIQGEAAAVDSKKATQIIGSKNSLGDNPIIRAAIVARTIAVREVDAIMTNIPPSQRLRGKYL